MLTESLTVRCNFPDAYERTSGESRACDTHLTASLSVSQNPTPAARRAGHVTSQLSSSAAAARDEKLSASLSGAANAVDGTYTSSPCSAQGLVRSP